MKIISVVGARPNFMKIAPFIKAIEQYNSKGNFPPFGGTEGGINHVLVHTGQHYDDSMSRSFFDQLKIPEADINLGIGSGTHAEQVGKTMIEFEKVLRSEKPDWVVVVGDVNATLACSVTAKKENVKCCHIEAGLRSGDMSMPEEINRLVTDRISDLLLTPDLISSENLRNEGVSENHIKFVGNIMIDTLETNRTKASLLNISEIISDNLIRNGHNTRNVKRGTTNLVPGAPHLAPGEYAVLTLHRPSNVDREEIFGPIMRFLMDEVTREFKLIWPIHPRAKKTLVEFGLFDEVLNHPGIILLEPLGYLDMLRMNMEAGFMLTDSGGLQEECTVLGTPCLTMRWNTERPVTLQENGGASVLVGNDIDRIRAEYMTTKNKIRTPFRPELWDGHAAERCLEAILNYRE